MKFIFIFVESALCACVWACVDYIFHSELFNYSNRVLSALLISLKCCVPHPNAHRENSKRRAKKKSNSSENLSGHLYGFDVWKYTLPLAPHVYILKRSRTGQNVFLFYQSFFFFLSSLAHFFSKLWKNHKFSEHSLRRMRSSLSSECKTQIDEIYFVNKGIMKCVAKDEVKKNEEQNEVEKRTGKWKWKWKTSTESELLNEVAWTK